jgi:Cdc6-like AAA superfamily ATPase
MGKDATNFSLTKINSLRTVISENIRVQLSGAPTIDYVDAGHSLSDALTRSNHVIFGRRGTGKTLLLQSIEKHVPSNYKTIYINCEDYKSHSFPNVLIELLDRLFEEMEKRLTAWFGRKKKLKTLLQQIRAAFQRAKNNPDVMKQDVKEATTQSASLAAHVGVPQVGIQAGVSDKTTFERQYQINDEKLTALNLEIPKLKLYIKEFFGLTDKVKAIFIELDDFYQLNRFDQPFIIDFVHRLCKDLPLYFKVGTLRHSTALYVDKKGQPFGAQERHDP